ncbi:MAG: DUF5060 domain-containing protein, partial [Chloroflexota bacterium]
MKKTIASVLIIGVSLASFVLLIFSQRIQTEAEKTTGPSFSQTIKTPDFTPTPMPERTAMLENSGITAIAFSNSVNKFDKLEIDFQIYDLPALNKQMPYLSAAHANEFTQDFVDAGISVDAVFTDPNGIEYKQPAFWYEEYDGLRATDNSGWKVRFSPHLAGDWQFKLTANFDSGSLETGAQNFVVNESNGKGFLSVAEADSRYFEFDNGEYYSNIGFNFSIKELDDTAEIEQLTENGINYVRAWITRMNITGGAWSHLSVKPTVYDGYLPRSGVVRYQVEGESHEEFWWRLAYNHDWYSSCLYTNQEYDRIQVKQNTNYLIQTEYATYDLVPADSSKDFGYTVMIQNWVDNCDQLESGNAVTEHSGDRNQQILVSNGVWNSGSSSSIPFVYPA